MTVTHPTTIATTTHGGQAIAEAVDATGACVGRVSTGRAPDGITVDFIDYPFSDGGVPFTDHLAAVKADRPKIAVAPDIQDGRDPGTVFEQADKLATYAETVVVVPKDIHPTAVPSRFRVGVPVANFGGELPFKLSAYEQAAREGQTLHLLGGSPTRHREVVKHLGDSSFVASVDTAAIIMPAQCGEVWAPTQESYWKETGAEQAGMYERIQWSIENMQRFWAADDPIGTRPDYEVPLSPTDYRDQQRRESQLKAIDREERHHIAGAHGACPVIRASDRDCLHPAERDELSVVNWSRRRAEAQNIGRDYVFAQTQTGLSEYGVSCVTDDGVGETSHSGKQLSDTAQKDAAQTNQYALTQF